ncbi:MAG: hypothetical protein ACREBZ_04360 [Thermoplasmata archaeon]
MAAPAKTPLPFRFRRLGKPEEFRQLEEVQRAAFGGTEESTLPVPLQRALQDNGGLILGAFVDIHLVGFSLGFIGSDGRQLYHYSHMTAVRPEYRNHRVGYRLKGYQREEVLAMGLDEIRWTFDPLKSRNAFLNVRLLGGRPTSYFPHYYGRIADGQNRGLETDRLRLHWAIETERVRARLEGRFPSAEEERDRWNRSSALVRTEPGESGIRLPAEVGEPSGPGAHLEIPFDLDLVRQHEPKGLGIWRHAVRDAFRAAYDLDYVVEDFGIVPVDHERRAFYFLRPATSEELASIQPAARTMAVDEPAEPEKGG